MTPQQATESLKNFDIKSRCKSTYFDNNNNCCVVGHLLKEIGIYDNRMLYIEYGIYDNSLVSSNNRLVKKIGLEPSELNKLQNLNDYIGMCVTATTIEENSSIELEKYIDELYDKYHPCIGI